MMKLTSYQSRHTTKDKAMANKKPRYVVPHTLADGKTMWRFSPPADIVENGIAKRCSLGTEWRSAYAEARRINKRIDDYRAGRIAGKLPKANSTFGQLVAAYLDSPRFKHLKKSTQESYMVGIESALAATVDGRKLSMYRIDKITTPMCEKLYGTWAKTGLVGANDKARIVSLLFNYAIRLGILERNPMRWVDKSTPKPRKVRWTREHIDAFLSVAYSDFKYRNIGLIVHMAYEWCQRIGDIRAMEWSQIDLETRTVTIEQSKRGATIYLPITEGLTQILAQQYEHFSFQKYVVPYLGSDKAYKPFPKTYIATRVREIKQLAGLPDDLQAWDLRRTGITELVQAGVHPLQMLQVTGHKSVSSVLPYVVNTYEGAKVALSNRFEEYKDGT